MVLARPSTCTRKKLSWLKTAVSINGFKLLHNDYSLGNYEFLSIIKRVLICRSPSKYAYSNLRRKPGNGTSPEKYHN